MDTVTLGMTGLEVSPIAFGTWQLSGDWGSFEEREAIEAIQFAREQGVNLFDTAQGYGWGASEQMLGRALREDLSQRREQVVIATKGGLRMDDTRGLVRDSSPEWLRSGVEQSLRSLEVDYIDIYQLHWPDPEVPFAQSAETLQKLVDEGKVRHIGVSNYGASQTAEFARTRPVETLQPPYSLLHREIEADVLPYAREHNIGVLVYGPLSHGVLTGAMSPETKFGGDDWRAAVPTFNGEPFQRLLAIVEELKAFAQERGYGVSQLAIAWTLAHRAVNVAIVGSRRKRHIEESIGALDLRLSDEDLAEINRILPDGLDVEWPTPERMTEYLNLAA